MRSLGRYYWRLCFAVIVSNAMPVLAQSPPLEPYSGFGRPTVIAPGDTIIVVSFNIGRATHGMEPPGGWFEVQYASRIAASDSLARHRQADRAATFFGPLALHAGYRRFSITLCDRPECAETRESTNVSYLYDYSVDEAWSRARP